MHRPALFPSRASTAQRTLAVGLVLAAGLAAAPANAAASPRSWQSYVLGPASPYVTAIRAEGRGQVTHPEGLVHGRGRPTTLTTVAGKTPASVVLDFGKDLAGTPYLDIAKVGSAATLSLVSGEALHATTPKNTGGTIAVPAGKHSLILLNGRTVHSGVTDGYARQWVPGGTYRITVLNR